MDTFYEQFLTTCKTSTYKIMKIVPYILFVFGAAMLLLGMLLLALVAVLIGAAAFYYKRFLYLEYEYIFTNGEIDIDRILEINTRKRMISFNIKEVELLASEDSAEYKGFANKPADIFQAFPNTSQHKVYVAIINSGNKKLQLRITPDQEFLTCCFKYNPRAVKR